MVQVYTFFPISHSALFLGRLPPTHDVGILISAFECLHDNSVGKLVREDDDDALTRLPKNSAWWDIGKKVYKVRRPFSRGRHLVGTIDLRVHASDITRAIMHNLQHATQFYSHASTRLS